MFIVFRKINFRSNRVLEEIREGAGSNSTDWNGFIFGPRRGYVNIQPNSFTHVQNEPSKSIVLYLGQEEAM